MTALSNFPINDRWPAQNPDIIQLYSFPTPNGIKISIALEELALPYEAHRINLSDDVQHPAFLSLSPNNKIPALIDPNEPDGQAVGIFESAAILIYLAEKTGQLLPADAVGRFDTLQWLMFQIGGIGPMFGQLGYFRKFAGAAIEDPRPLQRFVAEAERLLNVVDTQLEGKDWITGTYSIADIAIAPWLDTLEFYEAKDLVDWDSFENLDPYLARFFARDAVKRGKSVPPAP